MKWLWVLAVVLPPLLGALLLALSSWEARSRSRAPVASRGRAPVRRQIVLESHLATWGFCAGAAGGVGAAHRGLGWPELWLLPILIALVLLVPALVSGGRRVGRPYPTSLRWPLAPYQGVSILVAVLVESVGRWFWHRRAPVEVVQPAGNSPAGLRAAVRDLVTLTVEDVMVPRSQECAIQADLRIGDALRQASAHRYSQYPVFAESIDHTLGLVGIIDLTDAARADQPVRERVVSAPIVPETTRALALLGRLAQPGNSMALVVDEFGGHSGLVTLGDVVEVVIGDLVGEHEEVLRRIIPRGEGVYRVEGTCEITEFNEQVRPVLPEGEYDTVAGLILDRVGRIPQQGDDVVLPDAVLEVLERTDRRILWTEITLNRGRAVTKS